MQGQQSHAKCRCYCQQGWGTKFELWSFHVEELDNQPSYSQEHEVVWMNKEALLHLMEEGFLQGPPGMIVSQSTKYVNTVHRIVCLLKAAGGQIKA